MTDTKICVICNTTFTRAEGMTPNNWALQKYCSRLCRVRATTRKKGMRRDAPRLTPEQEAAKVEYDRRATEAYLEHMKESAQKQRQRAEVRRRGRVLERTG